MRNTHDFTPEQLAPGVYRSRNAEAAGIGRIRRAARWVGSLFFGSTDYAELSPSVDMDEQKRLHDRIFSSRLSGALNAALTTVSGGSVQPANRRINQGIGGARVIVEDGRFGNGRITVDPRRPQLTVFDSALWRGAEYTRMRTFQPMLGGNTEVVTVLGEIRDGGRRGNTNTAHFIPHHDFGPESLHPEHLNNVLPLVDLAVRAHQQQTAPSCARV